MKSEPTALIFALIKFGNRRHLVDLVERGVLYMRSLRYFRSSEVDSAGRIDPGEGLIHYAHPNKDMRLEIGGTLVDPMSLRAPFTIHSNELDSVNLFCLYAVTSKMIPAVAQGAPIVDERCMKFGDSAAVVRDVRGFVERVTGALRAKGVQEAYSRLVRYVDKGVDQHSMDHFTKFDDYEWQSEYRLAVHGLNEDPFVLETGSLRDIADVVPVESINDYIQFSPRPPGRPETTLLE